MIGGIDGFELGQNWPKIQKQSIPFRQTYNNIDKTNLMIVSLAKDVAKIITLK